MINQNDFDRLTEQGAFPSVTPEFDKQVRETLSSLDERPVQKRRRPLRFAATIGIAAALCLGGTAFAANVQNWFPTFFPKGGDEALAGFVVAPEPESTVASNENYKVELEAVLYDESTGAGLVSLKLTDLKNTGVMPFELSHVFAEYQNKDGLAWSKLVECYGNQDGQLAFSVLYNESDFCGGRFYLDETRSTSNTYYLEGAFVLGQNYTQGTPLRFELGQMGLYTSDSQGISRVAPVLTLELPESKPMPFISSPDGSVVLSPLGLHLFWHGSMLDYIAKVSLIMKDGSEFTIRDDANDIDHVLYGFGDSSPNADVYDIVTYVLASSFDIENVQGINIDGKTFSLS